MKIYLASSFLNKENARTAMDMLENAGHTITSDWTQNVPVPIEVDLVRESVQDLQGVKDADVFVMLWPGRMGSNAELGAALALGKPVILIGGINKSSSVYFNHPLVRVVATITDAIDRLKWISIESEKFEGKEMRELYNL